MATVVQAPHIVGFTSGATKELPALKYNLNAMLTQSPSHKEAVRLAIPEPMKVMVAATPPPPPLAFPIRKPSARPRHEHEGMPAFVRSILMEHCYARPSTWRPEADFLRPTRTLFMPQPPKTVMPTGDINVVKPDPECVITYDLNKARNLMDQCDKHVNGIRNSEEWDMWEERVPKIHWSNIQHNMFNSLVDILDKDRLGRLALAGMRNEPVLRRTIIDKSVRRYRSMMAKYLWDVNLIHWLHSVILDYANSLYLGIYLDLIQTLKHKVPAQAERIFSGLNEYGREHPLNAENLQHVMKKVWDPVPGTLGDEKPKQLQENPVIILVPNTNAWLSKTKSKRLKRWTSLLSSLARVVTVRCPHNFARGASIATCLEQMYYATRAKVQEVKNENVKYIVLVGCSAGSAVALQVAQVEPVTCVVSLGFSINTLHGRRGDADDNLLDLATPVLFVIGQLAQSALQEQMENIRERMFVETGLLMVGGADDYLRVSKKVRRAEGITQSMADRRIVDEIGQFAAVLINTPYRPQTRVMNPMGSNPVDAGVKRPKIERKRNNSNGSSLDSEPPSPTPRVVRPGTGRQSFKPKPKQEAKWQTTLQQGIQFPPSSPTNSNSITPPNPPSTPESSDSSEFQQGFKAINPPPTNDNYVNAKLQSMLYQGVTFTKGAPPCPRPAHVNKPPVIKGPLAPKTTAQTTLNGLDLTMSKMVQVPSQCRTYNNINYKNPPAGSNQLAQLLMGPQRLPSDTPTALGHQNQLKCATPRKRIIKKATQTYIPPAPPKPPTITQPTQNLPPPTNLTTQDILDLPIIFADDNQLLPPASSAPTQTVTLQALPAKPPALSKPSTAPTATPVVKQTPSKLVLINKQYAGAGQALYKQNVLKRAASGTSTSAGGPPVKFTKYVLSKASVDDSKKPSPNFKILNHLQFTPMEIDLERELVATTIPKRYVIEKATPTTTTAGATDYKTDVMSSKIITNKIKRAINEKAKLSLNNQISSPTIEIDD